MSDAGDAGDDKAEQERDQRRHGECCQQSQFGTQELARHDDAENVAAQSKEGRLPETGAAVLKDQEPDAGGEQCIEDRLRQQREHDLGRRDHRQEGADRERENPDSKDRGAGLPGAAHDRAGAIERRGHHVRCPAKPVGRQIRMTTISRNGSIVAAHGR